MLSLGNSNIYSSKLGTSSVSINSLIQPLTPISSCNSSMNRETNREMSTGHLVDITTASVCKLNATGFPPAAGGYQLASAAAGRSFSDCSAGSLASLPASNVCGLPDAHPDYALRPPASDPSQPPAMPSRCAKNGADLFASAPAFGSTYVQPQNYERNYENCGFNAFETPLHPRK